MRPIRVWRAASLCIGLVAVACASPRPSAQSSSSLATVVCDEEGTRIQGTAVEAQPDGVHLVIENRLGPRTTFVTQYRLGGGEGFGVPSGRSEHVVPIPPGRAEVGCWDVGVLERGGELGEPDLEVLRVLDPRGVYIDDTLGCVIVVASVASEGPGGAVTDLVAAVKEQLSERLEAGDVVEIAGYPEGPEEREVPVFRDGSVVAVVTFLNEGAAGWVQDELLACSARGEPAR